MTVLGLPETDIVSIRYLWILEKKTDMTRYFDRLNTV